MADNEQFLSRWARLKQEAARADLEPPLPAPAADTALAAADAAPADTAEPFDPATLPPLESIEAGSDITGFLARNVPADLVKAALRRAWAADPAIRDFVGLSENSWDFTAPDGVPGFGPMRAGDDVRQMLSMLSGGGPSRVDESVAAEAAPIVPQNSGESSGKTAQEEAGTRNVGEAHDPDGSERDTDEAAGDAHAEDDVIAAQDQNNENRQPAHPGRRAHGGALPE